MGTRRKNEGEETKTRRDESTLNSFLHFTLLLLEVLLIKIDPRVVIYVCGQPGCVSSACCVSGGE